MADNPSCSESSLADDEPLAGTATPGVTTWVLIENRGTWGKSIPDWVNPPLSDEVTQHLKRLARHPGVRLQFIRGGPGEPDGPLRVYVAGAEPRRLYLVSRELRSEAELLTLEISTAESWGTAEVLPLFLVCTHGRRDACCARKGVPIYQNLQQEASGRTWQCSHIGGHRFAPTVLTLPAGFLFGRLDGQECADLVAKTRGGKVGPLDRVRGRCCYDPVMQASEIFLRKDLGEQPVDSLYQDGKSDLGGGRWRCTWERGRRRYEVELATDLAATTALKSCSDEAPSRRDRFRLVSCREV